MKKLLIIFMPFLITFFSFAGKWTPEAVRKKNARLEWVVKERLKKGENLNKRIDECNRDENGVVGLDLPLIELAYRPQMIELFKEILNAGVNVNKQSSSGDTAIGAACFRENFEAAELLLQHGANPNQGNRRGASPLWWCVTNPTDVNPLRYRVAALLLEKEANPNEMICDSSGEKSEPLLRFVKTRWSGRYIDEKTKKRAQAYIGLLKHYGAKETIKYEGFAYVDKGKTGTLYFKAETIEASTPPSYFKTKEQIEEMKACGRKIVILEE